MGARPRFRLLTGGVALLGGLVGCGGGGGTSLSATAAQSTPADWQTFTSPKGFAISHPPEWTEHGSTSRYTYFVVEKGDQVLSVGITPGACSQWRSGLPMPSPTTLDGVPALGVTIDGAGKYLGETSVAADHAGSCYSVNVVVGPTTMAGTDAATAAAVIASFRFTN